MSRREKRRQQAMPHFCIGSTCAISALFQRVCSSPNRSHDAGADYPRRHTLASQGCTLGGALLGL